MTANLPQHRPTWKSKETNSSLPSTPNVRQNSHGTQDQFEPRKTLATQEEGRTPSQSIKPLAGGAIPYSSNSALADSFLLKKSTSAAIINNPSLRQSQIITSNTNNTIETATNQSTTEQLLIGSYDPATDIIVHVID